MAKQNKYVLKGLAVHAIFFLNFNYLVIIIWHYDIMIIKKNIKLFL